MKEIDYWFSSLSKKEKLIVLTFFYHSWDLEECKKIKICNQIGLLEFPPYEIDDSNPQCRILTQHTIDTLSDEMLFEKWNWISEQGKLQVKLNIELQSR